MKHWKSWIKVIGLALLAWVMSTMDWTRLLQVIRMLHPVYLAGYIGCFACMLLLRTARLRLVLSRLGYQVSFKHCYIATLEPAFMGLVTPGRLGEFTRVGYISTHGASLPEAIGIVTMERLVDVGLLLIFGVTGVLYIFTPEPYHLVAGVVATGGLLAYFGLIQGYRPALRFAQRHLRGILRWEPATLARHRQKLSVPLHTLMQCAARPVFFMGLACILLNFAQISLLSKAFGFQADYLVVFFAYTAATLVSLLPISVGGLGTREATYIMIMAREGISTEQALLFSITDGFVFGIIMLLVLLLPFWILHFIRARSMAKESGHHDE